MAVVQELFPSPIQGDTRGRVVFLDAARRCDASGLSRLLRSGGGGGRGRTTLDVNVRFSAGRTPLIQAAVSGNPLCVKLLLEAGAEVNLKDFTGRTALIYAVEGNKSTECVEILLKAGPVVDARDKNEATALMKAASVGNCEALRLLIQAGARIKRFDRVGNSALMLAAIYGHADCARVLLEPQYLIVSNSDKEGGRKENSTELEVKDELNLMTVGKKTKSARVKMEPEITETMTKRSKNNETAVDLCAFFSQRNKEGFTPLIAAINKTNLIGKERGKTTHITVTQSKLDCVRVFLSHGADVNVQDKYGRTALFHAALAGNKDYVESLLQAGADINLSDAKLESPLMAAVYNYDKDLVTLLIKSGANVNHTNVSRHSPLAYATLLRLPEAVGLLCESGADVNLEFLDTFRPEMLDGYKTDVELRRAQYLHCINVSHSLYQQTYMSFCFSNMPQRSALSFAVNNGDPEVVKMLLRHGVSVNINSTYRSLFNLLNPQSLPNGSSESLALLYAAGNFESMGSGNLFARSGEKESLKALCRRRIRTRLLMCMCYKRNLFVVTGELPLPSLLKSYLLYYVSLDDQEPEATLKIFKHLFCSP